MDNHNHPEVSATRRCLRVPELQHIIFDMVYRQLDGPSTLAALARTARCFQDVALDTLWNTQSSLVPLIKCFPESLWTETRDEDGFRVVSLVAEPTTEDWTRVKSYAARIRELSMSPSSLASQRLEGRLAGEAFVLLKNSLGAEPLLPNLNSFSWAQLGGEEAHERASFLLMLNPHVSTMKVLMTSWSEESAQAIATALNEYGEQATQLRSITVSCSTCPPVERAILALGFRQQNLQALVCTWESEMSLETITHLSRLNTLQQVSVKADRNTTAKLLEDARSTSGTFFSSLRLLALQTDSLELCEDWLGAIRSPMLDSLSFTVEEPPTAAVFHNFLARLASRRMQTGKLHKLRFSSKKAASRTSTQHQITPATLEPLLPLDLTTLQLDPGAPVDVDDDFLERAARAWPRLRTLELGSELRRYTAVPRVTLQGLFPLAQLCPDMNALGLPFVADASAFQQRFDAGDRPTDGISFGLGTPFVLGVGGAVVHQGTDTFLLAGVLSDLCPSLCAVQTAWDRSGRLERSAAAAAGLDLEREEQKKSWQQIDRFAVEMARVRRQERMWME